jgi:hypothetical protein
MTQRLTQFLEARVPSEVLLSELTGVKYSQDFFNYPNSRDLTLTHGKVFRAPMGRPNTAALPVIKENVAAG